MSAWTPATVDGVDAYVTRDGRVLCCDQRGAWTVSRALFLLTDEQRARAVKIAKNTITINMGPGR